VGVRPTRLPSIAALADADALGVVAGPVRSVAVEPLGGIGYSSAALSRVTITLKAGGERRYVLKCTSLGEDWMALRSRDLTGREAQLIGDEQFAGVWDVFDCPYVAFAAEADRTGLLMTDLTANLLPDARAPLSPDQEDALLRALAALHARFWNSPALDRTWLMTPSDYCDLLGPAVAGDAAAIATLSSQLKQGVPSGWTSAMPRLTGAAAAKLTCAGDEHRHAWQDLPRTLVHGDVKVANFAILPGGRVSAFDWAIAGAGPCTIDVGWYLAVNASRVTGTKEQLLARYRALLEGARGERIEDRTWRRLEEVAITCGARMLLWSKALALDAGRPGADAEWAWWVDRLERQS
jgi:Phosphotransferase enzyme family